MRSAGGFLTVVAVVVLVVGVALAGLALLTVVALPLALLLVLAVLALVAGVGMHLHRRHGSRRLLHRHPETAGAPAATQWTTQWESGPPVDAVPLTRQRVADVLVDWGVTGEAAEPALLVLTELLTNAVEHGRAPVRLTVGLCGPVLRVEVHDAAPGPPRLQPRDPRQIRGRGLQVVDGLATRWGWTGDPPGKLVWAEVPTAWPG